MNKEMESEDGREEYLGLGGVEDEPLGDEDDGSKWQLSSSPSGTPMINKILKYRQTWFDLEDDDSNSDKDEET
jgi:hypothetical protein